jgi:hypothetical protein
MKQQRISRIEWYRRRLVEKSIKNLLKEARQNNFPVCCEALLKRLNLSVRPTAAFIVECFGRTVEEVLRKSKNADEYFSQYNGVLVALGYVLACREREKSPLSKKKSPKSPYLEHARRVGFAPRRRKG